jgi:hypothetical protein
MAINSNDGDPTTWSSPGQQVEIDDPDLGQLQERVWHNYHFRLSPSHPMSVVLVERLTTDGCAKTNKPMWLAFVGLKMPPPGEVWRLYLRRFAIDHWYRFAKNCLPGTVPELSTPVQCHRWSDLMPIVTLAVMVGSSACGTAPFTAGKNLRSNLPLDGWLNRLGAF